jgi:hypothetical protein
MLFVYAWHRKQHHRSLSYRIGTDPRWEDPVIRASHARALAMTVSPM